MTQIMLQIFGVCQKEIKAIRDFAMTTPNEIFSILQEHGIAPAEAISALKDMVIGVVDNRIKEKENEDVMQMPDLIEHLKPYGYTRKTIDKWIMKAKRKIMDFPFHKAGRKLFFYRREIDFWLRSKC